MLKKGSTILTIAVIFSTLYAVAIITAPQTIGGSTFEAMSGQELDSIENPAIVRTITVQTQHMGVFSLTTCIASFFILFTGFRQGKPWAWWYFITGGLIAWGYPLVMQIIEGDAVNMTLCTIGLLLLLSGTLLPVKQFFTTAD